MGNDAPRLLFEVGDHIFADAAAHTISVPLSFNGFAQALDALAKE